MDLSEKSPLYRDFNYRTVILCKEQLLNRCDYEMVEAWVADVLTVEPSPNPGTETIPEEYTRRAGVWRTIEDELAFESDYQAEDYGSEADAVGGTMDVDYPVDIASSSSSMSTARSGPGGEAAEASQP